MRFLGLAIMAGIWTAACGHHGNQAGAADAPSPTDALECTAAQTLCGDTCADLMTDVSNCGACGHACGCGSTSCTAGICDAHVLAPSQGGPLVLALHDDQLYWGNDADRTVSTMPVTGGTASVLYPGRTQVRGIAFDPARIYFTRFVFNIVESGRSPAAPVHRRRRRELRVLDRQRRRRCDARPARRRLARAGRRPRSGADRAGGLASVPLLC
jgi:hypothetical protein